MEVFLASGNRHKANEFNELLKSGPISLRHSENKIEVAETGQSFNENAFLKAQAYYDKLQTSVLSDDSGLVVESLPEDLGIYSARFGGEGLSDRERAELVIEKLKGEENRKAYFVCVLCLYLGPDEIFFFEGRMNGLISHEYRGDAGFGYDPIFIPEKYGNKEVTIAEIPEWKKGNSHRALACTMLSEFLSK